MTATRHICAGCRIKKKIKDVCRYRLAIGAFFLEMIVSATFRFFVFF